MKEKRTWKKILFLIRPYKLYVLCSLLCALLSVTARSADPGVYGECDRYLCRRSSGAWRP